MKSLAVIPSDPIRAYLSIGYTQELLRDLYNPCGFFNTVYLLSPHEQDNPNLLGMHAIKTMPSQLHHRIKELNVDVVRAYGGYWACDMACSSKRSGIPVVVSVHDTCPQKLHDSIGKADIVLPDSMAVADLVLSKFPDRDRVWILPERVPFDKHFPHTRDSCRDLDGRYPFTFRVLHVGRRAEQKNLDTLIKAIKILGDNYCVIAVGKGNAGPYRELAATEGVADRCFFVEAIDNDELARYYSWSDCMCTPSRWEGFGIVFVEALACEAVVVTSAVGPMTEYVTHMENGLLVEDYEDPQALAETIRLACTNRELRNVLKGNARQSVARFEKNAVDRLEIMYYQKVLEMKQQGAFAIPVWTETAGAAVAWTRNRARQYTPLRVRRMVRSVLRGSCGDP